MAANEEPVLEEALENLREATQRLQATEHRMLAAGMYDKPNYRDSSSLGWAWPWR